MSLQFFDLSSTEDSRGVSTVIGFIFIFAIIMILFSINQAQIVPQENREIEFQHFQDVRNEMIEVRSSISTAGQANISQYPTVTLGTNYPRRLFAVNPPSPSGTLQTSQEYNISIYNTTGSEPENVTTRFLEYRNGYNEMDIGSIWYEHSVLYLDERENTGEIAVIADQNLIRGGDSVRITALQNEYSKTSTGRVTIELYPVENTTGLDELSGDVNLEIPTRLNASEYWEGQLGDFDEYNGVEEDGVRDGIHVLKLTVDAESLKFNTVGIDSAPEDHGSASQRVGPANSGDIDAKTAFFNVTIIDTNSPVLQGQTVEVTAEIENTGDLEDTQKIELLDFDGNVVDSSIVSLTAGESQTVTLYWETGPGDRGTDDITVRTRDDSDTKEVAIRPGNSNQ